MPEGLKKIPSMTNYTLRLPSWTVGEHALRDVEEITSRYGKSAAVIGGERALSAILYKIRAVVGKKVRITDTLLYGGEASEENILRLSSEPSVKNADMIFAVGGGKALDTCKALGYRLDKPVFTFPTIASTCAACTAVAILYRSDGSFSGPCFLPGPPIHTFIDTDVIASAPVRYLWAGLGDTYAKYFESAMSARGDETAWYHSLGVNVSTSCRDCLLTYGAAAWRDHLDKRATEELTRVILTVIVTTAIASILLTADRVIDYNTGLAHAIFYALTAFPEIGIEKDHLHGEVVGFGVLILLLVDGQEENFRKIYALNRSVGLPTAPEDIGVTRQDLERVLPKVIAMHDIDHNPYPITLEMLSDAFGRLQEYDHENKKQRRQNP